MSINNDFNLAEVVKRAINTRIKEIAEEEYTEAEKRIEKRRPEAIAGTVLEIEKYVSMERMGQTLRIEIKERNN